MGRANLSFPGHLCSESLARIGLKKFTDIATLAAQLSINGVGLTKPLTTSLNPTSKHSSHLRKPSKGVGRGEVGTTGYQPNIDAW